MKPRRASHYLLDATAATLRMGVKKATLYSYVSRGLVRVADKPGEPREKLYDSRDIDVLLARKQLRRPAKAVEQALDFGMPVLETSITQIEDGRLFYRGLDAVAFASTATLEDAAKLLWQVAPDDQVSFRFDKASVNRWRETERSLGPVATDRAMTLLPLMLPSDQSHVRRHGFTEQAGVLVGAVAAAALQARSTRVHRVPMHVQLAARWNRPGAAEAIRLALVLCADHELNASAFAVRVVASTDAKLTASLMAGLAALSGSRHGAMTSRFAQLLSELPSDRKVPQIVAGRLARGEGLPGYDHPLYPDGDPRGTALLAAVPRDRIIEAVSRAAYELSGTRPTLDVGLVAVERAFSLPPGAALALFTIGRSVGWVAQALEQRQSHQLIRPRARYVHRNA